MYTMFRNIIFNEPSVGIEPTTRRYKGPVLPLNYEGIIYVKMDELYLHFTQCFSLDYHQQHRIGCFLTLLSTTLLVVTLPPLTRFIFILICTWIGFSYVTPQTTFLPFSENSNLHWHVKHLTISLPLLICCVTYN